MKFLALLILLSGSVSLACDTCSDSKEIAPKVKQAVELPTHIKVFTDFTCRYCKAGSQTMSDLIKKYGSLVEIEPVAYPLSKKGPAVVAAQFFEAVKKMAPEKSLDYAKSLHKSDDKTKASFIALAKKLGIDSKKLEKLANSNSIKRILTENREAANRNNIKGLPGYLFNNSHVVVGARPLSYFEDLFGNPMGNGDGC